MEEKQMRYWLFLLLVVLLILINGYAFIMLVKGLQPLFQIIGKIILPFAVAGLITYLLHPLIEWAYRHRVGRGYAILLIYLAVIGTIVLAVIKGTPHLIAEGKEMIEQLPEMANSYRSFVQSYDHQAETLPEPIEQQADHLLEQGEQYAANLVTRMVASLKALVDYTFALIVVPFIVFYLLKDYDIIEKVAWYLTPKRFRKHMKQLAYDIDKSLGGYIRGQIIVGVVVFVFSFIGFLIIDMPYALMFALFIGATNIIPYFGPIIGAAPVLLVATAESLQLALFALLVIVIVQMLEGNVLAPLIVGKSLHMHPVLIIFALVIGAELAGVIGLILSVPLLAVLKVIVVHVRGAIRVRRGMIKDEGG
ncbi:AI-2E family transporter [Texcoconibacillus texcoconensis]|nr:AI-2E family transporter [Texcoconibacillus texcoconensis]